MGNHRRLCGSMHQCHTTESADYVITPNRHNYRSATPIQQKYFEDNTIDTFYPQRFRHIEAICLYEFVAEYTKSGVDADGNIVYRKAH